MFTDFVFNRDVFLKTDHPIAVDSEDHWSPEDQSELYHNKPLSFMCDFYSGAQFAETLLKEFPGKRTLLDLGTATGSVPLTMRGAGILALGVDGLDAGKKGTIEARMLPLGHPSNATGKPCSELFAWNVAPEIVDCCDITKPFCLGDAEGKQIKLDFIYSSDCFEHLITERVPALVDNVYENLADDGFGIFEVNIGAYAHLHQTIKPLEWWKAAFSTKFIIDEERSTRDYPYTRSYRKDGELRYFHSNSVDEGKVLFWVRKG